jgi:hypothetical protein
MSKKNVNFDEKIVVSSSNHNYGKYVFREKKTPSILLFFCYNLYYNSYI